MIIYGDLKSGNCYKIKLVTNMLDIEHQWINIDIMKKETFTDSFLKMNPNGKIPLLQLDDGRFLSESNAIINYLIAGSKLDVMDRYDSTKVQQWQFFEQYSHEPYIAVARYIELYLGLPEERREEYESKREGGYKALSVMEKQLEETPFLVGERLTAADISLFAYTHVANEGGFDLSGYPYILKWIERIKNYPGFIAMK